MPRTSFPVLARLRGLSQATRGASPARSRCPDAEAVLRDVAYVLHLTRTVRESISEGRAVPGGPRS